MNARIAIAISSVWLALAGTPMSADAQIGPTPQAPPKQIGVPSHPDTEIVPSLIVLNSRAASLQGLTLTLSGVSPNAIIFADRPTREAGHVLMTTLLEEWGASNDASFRKDPPNATVSVFSKDASSVKDAVVVLKSPKLQGDNLTFDVEVLEGSLDGADGAAAVFVDIIGMPFTPLSFAGVARRSAARAAFYSQAATAYRPPYGYYPYTYPPPPAYAACGFYPQPPC